MVVGRVGSHEDEHGCVEKYGKLFCYGTEKRWHILLHDIHVLILLVICFWPQLLAGFLFP